MNDEERGNKLIACRSIDVGEVTKAVKRHRLTMNAKRGHNDGV